MRKWLGVGMPRPEAWAGAPWQPRAWQAEALPRCVEAVEEERYGLVIACTGSGKSILIAEVCRQVMHLGPVVLVTPTRRLVAQLGTTLRQRLGPLSVGLYYTDAKQSDRPVTICCNASARSLAERLKKRGVRPWLLLCDEAHRTEAATLRQAVDALDPERVLGFTATPFRSEADESLQLFEEELYRYDIRAGLRDGVIVPWRVVPWTKGEAELDEAVIEMVRMHGVGPGVVNASSVADAERFAARLREADIPAMAVHSGLYEDEQDRRLRMLERGELRVVVYPSLLSEGADFPWLRWMCLRRKVGSRVRFVQEVGRVLRTAEGKTEAIVLDPHNLFGEFSLIVDAVLGEAELQPETEGPESPGREGPADEEAPDGPVSRIMLSPLASLDGWAAQLRAAAEVDGLVALRLPLPAARRAAHASPRQLDTLLKMRFVSRWLPAEHGALLRELAEARAIGTAGAATDLLDVVMALASRKRAWAPRLPVFRPDVDLAAVQGALEEGPLHAAGLVWKGVYAAVALRGLRVLHQVVRRAVAEESGVMAAVEAALHAGAHARHPTDDPVHIPAGHALEMLVGRRPPSPEAATLMSKIAAGPFQLRPIDKNAAKEACFREITRFLKRDAARRKVSP